MLSLFSSRNPGFCLCVPHTCLVGLAPTYDIQQVEIPYFGHIHKPTEAYIYHFGAMCT